MDLLSFIRAKHENGNKFFKFAVILQLFFDVSVVLNITLNNKGFARCQIIISNRIFPIFTEHHLQKLFYSWSTYKTVFGLLSDKEKALLSNRSRKGRTGYTLFEIFGIMMLKQIYGVPTIKATLQLLEDNQNLCTILNIEKIPSEATVSHLSKRIESVINISGLMERLITQYDFDMDRTIGHLSIDSTIVEAREKPIKINKSHPIGKRGRKKIGSEEQRQYLLRKAEEAICPLENPDVTLRVLIC